MRKNICVVFMILCSTVSVSQSQVDTNAIPDGIKPDANTTTMTASDFRALESVIKKYIGKNELSAYGYVGLMELYDDAPQNALSKTVSKKHVINMYIISISKALRNYNDNPSKMDYLNIESALFGLISLDEKRSEGYFMLSLLYQSSLGSVLSPSEAMGKRVDILEQYQGVDDRYDDLSEKLEFAIDGQRLQADHASIVKSTEEMMDSENQPMCVLEARKLLENSRQSGDRQNLLNEAEQILLQGQIKDPENYKIYVQLYHLYENKGDYASAYIMWRLALNYGGDGVHAIEALAANMYLFAAQCAIDFDGQNAISLMQRPIGRIWMNREELVQSLPAWQVVDMDRTIQKIRSSKEEAQ